jgi:hypothetical protein
VSRSPGTYQEDGIESRINKEQIPALVMSILRAMTARDPSPGKIPVAIWRTGAIRASLVRVAAQ